MKKILSKWALHVDLIGYIDDDSCFFCGSYFGGFFSLIMSECLIEWHWNLVGNFEWVDWPDGWWKKSHQFIWKKTHVWQSFIHPRWYRISSINRMMKSEDFDFDFQIWLYHNDSRHALFILISGSKHDYPLLGPRQIRLLVLWVNLDLRQTQ